MAKKEVNYTKALEELKKIVADLQDEKVSLDEVVEKVKKGLELVSLCREKIMHAEIQVQKIVKSFEK